MKKPVPGDSGTGFTTNRLQILSHHHFNSLTTDCHEVDSGRYLHTSIAFTIVNHATVNLGYADTLGGCTLYYDAIAIDIYLNSGGEVFYAGGFDSDRFRYFRFATVENGRHMVGMRFLIGNNIDIRIRRNRPVVYFNVVAILLVR